MRHFIASFFSLMILPGLAFAQTPPVAPAPPVAAGHQHDLGAKWKAKFDAANTSHDGHLTLAQAQAAGLKPIADHFAEIDAQHRGYVTFNEFEAWHLDEKAQRMEQRAAQLRAQD